MTANLTAFDWEGCIQNIWLSPILPVKPKNYKLMEFQNLLLRYLKAYSHEKLKSVITKIQNLDMNQIK